MTLRELEYFVAVAEHRHFRRAAESVHASQPTLSMQLRKLEQSLGSPLFERRKNEVLLTRFGERVLPMAQNVLREARRIAEAAEESAPLGGELRLGVFPTLAPYLLPHLVSILRAGFPAVVPYFYEEKTRSLIDKLSLGELDCAIVALPAPGGDFAALPLFEERFLLAVPTEHPLAGRRSVDPAALKHCELLLLEEGHCLREQSLEVCNLAGAKENPAFHASSVETVKNMVAAGVGITLIPELAVGGTRKRIVYLPFNRREPRRSVALVHRRTSHRGELYQALAEKIRAKMAGLLTKPRG